MKRINRLAFLLAMLFIIGSSCFAAETRPKVVFLATGGTIASVKSEKGLRPAYTPEELIGLAPEIKKYAQIESHLLMNIDSTNMQPSDWIIIGSEIMKAHKKGCRGIVIAHGTDTMAYTASALSFMIKNPALPIVLTGAFQPAGTVGGDAEKNLLQAVQFASYGPPGIYVVFNGKVIKGVKASKINPSSKNAFDSINGPLAAEFSDYRNIASERPGVYLKNICFSNEFKGPMTLSGNLEKRVYSVKLTPGYDPRILSLLCNRDYVRGLVIEAFGVGNIPFREPCNLIPALIEFKNAGIPVVVLSQCPYGRVDMNIYQTGREASRTGVIPGGPMTKEAAVTKLMWVLGQTSHMNQIRKLMLEDIAGEMR